MLTSKHQLLQFLLRSFFSTTPSASPRQGTWLTRPDPRPEIEGTLHVVPVKQVEPSCIGLMPVRTMLCASSIKPFSWFGLFHFGRSSQNHDIGELRLEPEPRSWMSRLRCSRSTQLPPKPVFLFPEPGMFRFRWTRGHLRSGNQNPDDHLNLIVTGNQLRNFISRIKNSSCWIGLFPIW